MAKALPPGILATKTGFRVFVRLSRAKLASKSFPHETSLPIMKDWRERERVKFKSGPKPEPPPDPPPPPPDDFAHDAARYLKSVADMPTIDDRTRDINAWIAVFGPRLRSSITSAEIAAQLAGWELSASSLNHRRTALSHLWRILDGKSAANPVREVKKRREPDAEPRSLPYDTIRKIFDAMTDSATKARLRVIAWTGIPHAQLARITAGDIDLKRRTVYVHGRSKGHGSKGRVVPLTPESVDAFKAFIQWDAFGTFSRSSLWKSFRLACGKVEAESIKAGHPISLKGVRPYDLRHSWGSALYAAQGDIRAVQILLGHSKPEMTHRYTLGAVDERVKKTLRAVAQKTRKRRKVTRKGHTSRKR